MESTHHGGLYDLINISFPIQELKEYDNKTVKIIDLEHEIDEGIDRLVDLKQEIVSLIKQVKNPEYQTLLELRYLCFRTWEQIAVEMHYELRYLRKLHRRALEICSEIQLATRHIYEK